MKMLRHLLLLLALVAPACAQTLDAGKTWRYQLIDGAAIMDDCMICGRPSFWLSLRGSFDLVGTSTPSSYIVTNLMVFTPPKTEPAIEISGNGTLSYTTGEPVLTLQVMIR